MRKQGRTDANQESIVEALRKIPGVSVAITSSLGNGFPDICVGHKGRNFFFEIKTDDKQKLTKDEIAFSWNWRGQWIMVSQLEQILHIVGIE